jgi:hypothetical protein
MQRVFVPALIFIAVCWLWLLLKGPKYWKRRIQLDREAYRLLYREHRRMTAEEAAAFMRGEPYEHADRKAHDVGDRRREISDGAREFALGSINIHELWDLWHRNVVALVANGPLEGDLAELSLGLRIWEQAEDDQREAAEARIRLIAERLGRAA